MFSWSYELELERGMFIPSFRRSNVQEFRRSESLFALQ